MYRVNWHDFGGAGTFPASFDTYEDADAYGREWADARNLEDPPDDLAEAYRYEVVVTDDPLPGCH